MQTRLQRGRKFLNKIDHQRQIGGKTSFAELPATLPSASCSGGDAATSLVTPFEIFTTSKLRKYRASSREKCCRLRPFASRSATTSSIALEFASLSALATVPSESSENMPSSPRTSAAFSSVPQHAIA